MHSTRGLVSDTMAYPVHPECGSAVPAISKASRGAQKFSQRAPYSMPGAKHLHSEYANAVRALFPGVSPHKVPFATSTPPAA